MGGTDKSLVEDKFAALESGFAGESILPDDPIRVMLVRTV
jgi:hypothetical protein